MCYGTHLSFHAFSSSFTTSSSSSIAPFTLHVGPGKLPENCPASNDMWGPDGLTTGSMGTVWAWALAG